MVRPAGFEPATPALGKPCSIQLSYGRVSCELSLQAPLAPAGKYRHPLAAGVRGQRSSATVRKPHRGRRKQWRRRALRAAWRGCLQECLQGRRGRPVTSCRRVAQSPASHQGRHTRTGPFNGRRVTLGTSDFEGTEECDRAVGAECHRFLLEKEVPLAPWGDCREPR